QDRTCDHSPFLAEGLYPEIFQVTVGRCHVLDNVTVGVRRSGKPGKSAGAELRPSQLVANRCHSSLCAVWIEQQRNALLLFTFTDGVPKPRTFFNEGGFEFCILLEVAR